MTTATPYHSSLVPRVAAVRDKQKSTLWQPTQSPVLTLVWILWSEPFTAPTPHRTPLDPPACHPAREHKANKTKTKDCNRIWLKTKTRRRNKPWWWWSNGMISAKHVYLLINTQSTDWKNISVTMDRKHPRECLSSNVHAPCHFKGKFETLSCWLAVGANTLDTASSHSPPDWSMSLSVSRFLSPSSPPTVSVSFICIWPIKLISCSHAKTKKTTFSILST